MCVIIAEYIVVYAVFILSCYLKYVRHIIIYYTYFLCFIYKYIYIYIYIFYCLCHVVLSYLHVLQWVV
jgi:hypothetical protein